MANGVSISDKYKKIFWAAFSPLLAMLTVWALLKQNERISMSEIVHTAAGANKFWFGLSVASSFIYILFEGMALCTIIKGAGLRTKKRNCALYSTADIYFSAITPSATGGQPASAYFMLRDGIPAGVATAVLLLNLMMYTMSIVVLGFISVIICPQAFVQFNALSKAFIGAGIAVQLGLSVFFMMILKNGDLVFGLMERFVRFLGRKKIIRNPKRFINKIIKIKTDYSSCSRIFSGNVPLLIKAFLWNLFQRFSQIIVPALIYISLGGRVGDGVMLFSKQSLITIGYSFVPLPGAMGVADYLMIQGFSEMMSRDMAFNLELLSRGITFYICVTVSGLITLLGYIIKRRYKSK